MRKAKNEAKKLVEQLCKDTRTGKIAWVWLWEQYHDGYSQYGGDWVLQRMSVNETEFTREERYSLTNAITKQEESWFLDYLDLGHPSPEQGNPSLKKLWDIINELKCFKLKLIIRSNKDSGFSLDGVHPAEDRKFKEVPEREIF